MNFPKELKYTKEDEWVKVEGNVGAVGITDYAQDALGDIVFVELPKVGSEVTAGKSFGTVESVKAVSELYSPLTGTVTAINEALNTTPETVNTDPYGAWMIKVQLKNPGEVSALMDADAYSAYAAERKA